MAMLGGSCSKCCGPDGLKCYVPAATHGACCKLDGTCSIEAECDCDTDSGESFIVGETCEACPPVYVYRQQVFGCRPSPPWPPEPPPLVATSTTLSFDVQSATAVFEDERVDWTGGEEDIAEYFNSLSVPINRVYGGNEAWTHYHVPCVDGIGECTNNEGCDETSGNLATRNGIFEFGTIIGCQRRCDGVVVSGTLASARNCGGGKYYLHYPSEFFDLPLVEGAVTIRNEIASNEQFTRVKAWDGSFRALAIYRLTGHYVLSTVLSEQDASGYQDVCTFDEILDLPAGTTRVGGPCKSCQDCQGISNPLP